MPLHNRRTMIERPILLDLPERLVGERVVVRPWLPGDGAALYEAVQESLDHLHPWLPWGPTHGSVEDSEARVRRFYANWILREDMPLAIVDKESGRLIGGTGIHRMNWEVGSFEIGYWVRASEHGRGYVTEAVQLVIDLIKLHMDPARIFIRCAAGNERSAAIPLRLGFTEEGPQRNGIRDANGLLHDVRFFALIP